MPRAKKHNRSSSASSECGDDQANFTRLLETALKSEAVISCLKKAITNELQQANIELKYLIIEKDRKIAILETSVDDLEQYTRIDDIIISGLGVRHSSYARAAAHANARETPDTASQDDLENVEDQVVGLFGSRGNTVDKREISACHLLKAKNPTDKHPIIVRFVNRKSNVNILRNGRNLKGTNVYVNEHLSRKNADIAGFARQLKRRQRIHSTWTRNCKVLIKTNGAPDVARVIMIREKSELDRFNGD